MAPEQAEGGVVGPSADAWGLGMVLFIAATGRSPFDDDEGYPQSQVLARQVAEGRAGGGAIAAIIDALLNPVPEGRPLLPWVAAELSLPAADPRP
jgi:serine/threonine-protein kinase